MSSFDVQDGHPTDALPEYARGVATETAALERHLAVCEACRVELEVLRALHESGPTPLSDLERQRVYRSFEAKRARTTVRALQWRPATWKAAASLTLLLGSVGVWQAVQGREESADWSPELALDGWSEDLADLDVGPGAVRLAFGVGTGDEILWEALDGVDPYDLAAPWEEN